MSRPGRPSARLLASGLLALWPALGAHEEAADAVQDGNARYAAGDPAAALERYEAAEGLLPGRPEIAFDRGIALARLGETERALEQLMAVLAAADPGLRSRAKHGIGTIRLQQAMAPERPVGEATWQARAAVRHLRESLELDRGRDDARHDLELAYRVLGALERRQDELRQRDRAEEDRTTHQRGQALQDLLQNQAGEQEADPDQLKDNRPQASDQTPANFSAREPEPGRNDKSLPVAMDPQAAAELMERLLEELRKAEAWRTEQRRTALKAPGEREPW